MSNINLLFRDHLCKSLITGCAVTVPRDSLLRFLSILLCPKFSDSPALEMTANTEDVCQSLTPLFTQHRVGDGEKMRKYYSANIDKFSCICCYCLAQVQDIHYCLRSRPIYPNVVYHVTFISAKSKIGRNNSN